MSSEQAEVERLLRLLRSTDPATRDDFACSALSDLVASEEADVIVIRQIAGRCTQALRGPLLADDSSVLDRSYSCVVLNAVLEADLSRQFLSAVEWTSITEAILSWWSAETDNRGHDSSLGWVHCIAHGADTILLASQSQHSDPQFRSGCLERISRKLISTTRVFEGYEDLRCALAFSAAVFGGRTDDALVRAAEILHSVSSPRPGTPEWMAKVNVTNFLTRLYALWSVGISRYPPDFQRSVFRPPGLADKENLAWLTELLKQFDDFRILMRLESRQK